MDYFEVVTIRTERRTYRVPKSDYQTLELAEEAVLDGDAEPLDVDITDEFVHDSREADDAPEAA